jgi:hypothetical protein
MNRGKPRGINLNRKIFKAKLLSLAKIPALTLIRDASSFKATSRT